MIPRSAFALLLLAVPLGAAAKTGACFLQVDGQVYLDGPCNIEISDDGFSIGAGDKKRSKYFASVSIFDDATFGFWNGTPAASHAHQELGERKQDGSCWTNARAKICRQVR
jgi:hypothetical protein